jgi:hypothetical protein
MIDRVDSFNQTNLVAKLRRVRMLDNPAALAYEQAAITIESLQPALLSPPQNYVLRSQLRKIRGLRWDLRELHEIDIFGLVGYLKLILTSGEVVTLLPPIVEESVEADGVIHHIVADGMHRIYLALAEQTRVNVVFIRNIPKMLPYYAYPIRGGWASVEERDTLPENYIKKWHRIPNYKSLYRDFNSQFKNVGSPRGTTDEEEPKCTGDCSFRLS